MAENPDSRPGSLSRSRSRSREPSHTSGRGGVGNLHLGGPTEKVIEELDESERAAHLHPLRLCVSSPLFRPLDDHLTELFCFYALRHTVGRGGTGNITPDQLPHLENVVNPRDPNHPHASHVHGAESTGRGGSGNISHENVPKDTPHYHGHGLSKVLHGIVHG